MDPDWYQARGTVLAVKLDRIMDSVSGQTVPLGSSSAREAEKPHHGRNPKPVVLSSSEWRSERSGLQGSKSGSVPPQVFAYVLAQWVPQRVP